MKRSISFKNIFLLMICTLFIASAFLFVGCGKEPTEQEIYEKQGYTAVWKVSYSEGTTVSSPQEIKSRYRLKLTTPKEVSEEEYYTATDHIHLNSVNEIFNDVIYSMELDKTGSFSSKSKFKANGLYETGTKYFLVSIEEIIPEFVYVKIKNTNQLEIVSPNRIHYFVSTNYYEVVYFN